MEDFEIQVSDRGFARVEFQCCYEANGLLAESSCFMNRLWLGVAPSECDMRRRMDPNDPYYDGWDGGTRGALAQRFGAESLLLDRKMAGKLAKLLKHFSKHGKLPEKS